MSDYSELVKALRERAQREEEWYEHGGDVINDAAAQQDAGGRQRRSVGSLMLRIGFHF